MTTFICTNVTCQKKISYGLFSRRGTKTCPVCGHQMAKEGSPKLKLTPGKAPAAHIGGPAIRLPEPPLRGQPSGSKSITPPNVDLASLQSGVLARQARAKTSAEINRRLVYKMTPPGGVDYNFDMPIKYQCYKTGLAKQDFEFTIKIPIKVFSGADALSYWESKGYARDAFSRTVHGGEQLGVTGAVFNDTVRQRWSAKVNKCWGKAGVLWVPKSGSIQCYALKFEFIIVDDIADAAAGVACVTTSGAAHTINPTGTIDAVRWGVDDIDPDTFGPVCHEVGHMIGNPDEYYTIEYDGMTKKWGPGYQKGMGVMNNPDNPPLIRNYKPLAVELANAFNIPLNEAYVIENIAMPSSSKRHRLDTHIWS